MAVENALSQSGEVGVESSVEPDHQRRARRPDDLEAARYALGVEVDGLLAEDRLLGASGAFDQIGMHVRRRADRDGVDVARAENFFD